MPSAASSVKERLEIIDTELGDVSSRLSKLYDALEMGKLSLVDKEQVKIVYHTPW